MIPKACLISSAVASWFHGYMPTIFRNCQSSLEGSTHKVFQRTCQSELRQAGVTEVSLPVLLYIAGGAKRTIRPGAADKNPLSFIRPISDSKFSLGMRRELVVCGTPENCGDYVSYLG